MITFLRKLRRKLLNEGQLRKYLVYGAGEILLVVIGILLALQINNWNQYSKDRETESVLLKAILSNLDEDALTLGLVIDRLALSMISMERIYSGTLPIPDDSLRYYVTRAHGDQTFIPITSAFDLSSNSGKLDLIQNDDLRLSIQRLYIHDYKSMDRFISIFRAQMDQILNYESKHDVFDMSEYVKSRRSYLDMTFEVPFNIQNLRSMLADPELQARHRRFRYTTFQISQLHEGILEINEALRSDIRSYLESF